MFVLFSEFQTIDVIIDLVTSHNGFFAFALCENNNPEKDSDQSCFMKHILKFKDGSDKFVVPSRSGRVNLKVKLPGKNILHNNVDCYVVIIKYLIIMLKPCIII